jgi:hypothetical protein
LPPFHFSLRLFHCFRCIDAIIFTLSIAFAITPLFRHFISSLITPCHCHFTPLIRWLPLMTLFHAAIDAATFLSLSFSFFRFY